MEQGTENLNNFERFFEPSFGWVLFLFHNACGPTKPEVVSGPLIPYIVAPEIPLAFLEYVPYLNDLIDPHKPPSIKPFGTLVALGVYTGSVLSVRRTRERGLDARQMSDFLFWVTVFGFVISHLLDAIFYHPQTVLDDPLYLLRVWEGLSSYGGFIGAAVGAFAWRFYRKKRPLEFVDICASVMPLAWVFGRTGCSVVHDHPGAVSDVWFAVQFPNVVCPAGYPPDAVCGRFDLGLMEMVLTIPLAIACLWLWHRQPFRPTGFYIGLILAAYAPVRFFLDFLRLSPESAIFRGATDPRYGGLTPAQWACFLALGAGLWLLRYSWGKPYVRTADLGPDEELEEYEEYEDEAGAESDPAEPSGPGSEPEGPSTSA